MQKDIAPTLPLNFVFQTKFSVKNGSNSGFWLLGPTNQLCRATGQSIHPCKPGRDVHISVNMAPRNKIAFA